MTKDDIVSAAFNVWGRELYKTTSLSLLAEHLGVSKPALYRHFPDKKSLLKAMENRFYNDYIEEIRPFMGEVSKVCHWQDWFSGFGAVMIAYFALHFDRFIFLLTNIQNNEADLPSFDTCEFQKRGIPFAELPRDFSDERQYPSPLFLAGLTALCETAHFHKKRFRKSQAAEKTEGAAKFPLMEIPPPSREEAGAFAESAVRRIRHGLGFDREEINALSFTDCEEKVRGVLANGAGGADDPMLKAIAEAIAESGPWKVSMETVAKRLGFSKSSLYAHFKSKRDMLSHLFMTEFERIAETAAACFSLSQRREERLYLALFSITEYLRVRPEILTALDWIRVQRLDLDLSVPSRLYDFFGGLNRPLRDSEAAAPAVNQAADSGDISQWALFLVVSLFIQHYRLKGNFDLPETAVRDVFRFITLGIEGIEGMKDPPA